MKKLRSKESIWELIGGPQKTASGQLISSGRKKGADSLPHPCGNPMSLEKEAASVVTAPHTTGKLGNTCECHSHALRVNPLSSDLGTGDRRMAQWPWHLCVAGCSLSSQVLKAH